MKTNASVQCAHFPVCAGTRLEVTLVTAQRDMKTREERIPHDAKTSMSARLEMGAVNTSVSTRTEAITACAGEATNKHRMEEDVEQIKTSAAGTTVAVHTSASILDPPIAVPAQRDTLFIPTKRRVIQ